MILPALHIARYLLRETGDTCKVDSSIKAAMFLVNCANPGPLMGRVENIKRLYYGMMDMFLFPKFFFKFSQAYLLARIVLDTSCTTDT